MKAVILAAGQSTRTYPLTLTRPKPLLTIANKTLLEHNLEQLQGIVDEAIIIVGYKKELIMERFGDSFGNLKIQYVEQREQLGTGHAIMQAKELIKDRFIVIMGDDLYSARDIKNCIKHEFCVLAQKVENPERFGVFVLKDNFVDKIVEKPKEFVSDLANTGLYILNRRIFDVDVKKTERGEFEITDMITDLAKKEKISCEVVRDYWFAIGYPWHLLDANKFFVDRVRKTVKKGKIEKNARIHGKVILGKGSVILSGTYIEGNVIIGENCKIGPNCYIRGSTSIGNGCRIGQAVEVKNIILMNGSKIPHLSYIGDSVIGENVNLGAGTITGNLRHDNANVKSMVKDELIDSGRRKFGTIIGDDVHTGIDTQIYPGRKIWPRKTTIPGEVIRKDIK